MGYYYSMSLVSSRRHIVSSFPFHLVPAALRRTALMRDKKDGDALAARRVEIHGVIAPTRHENLKEIIIRS